MRAAKAKGGFAPDRAGRGKKKSPNRGIALLDEELDYMRFAVA